MDIDNAILSRRSIRSFSDKEVSKETINSLIEAAILAPSAGNKQGWRFIVVDSKEIKDKLCAYNGIAMPNGHDLIQKAPLGIVVIYRNDVSKNIFEYKDHIQSASAAIENLLLKATDLGLGACWICKLPTQRKMRKIFNIPKCYDVVAYVALGYPGEYISNHTLLHYEGDKEKALARPRKYTVEEVVSYNSYEEREYRDRVYSHPKMVARLQKIQLSLDRNKKHTITRWILAKVYRMLGVK